MELSKLVADTLLISLQSSRLIARFMRTTLKASVSECVAAEHIDKSRGYGYVWRDGRQYRAHRVAYCDHNGVSLESIKGIFVRHTCDNPPCINPHHLILGTAADNMADKVSRGRQSRGETHTIAKLTQKQVTRIREVYKPRDPVFGAAALARLYGVCSSTVNQIITGRNWSIRPPEENPRLKSKEVV